MVRLTDEQVSYIEERISGGVTTAALFDSLLDHFCCYVEERMDAGLSFEAAYEEAYVAIAPNGMQEIEDELQILLTFKNDTNMKRAILITGAVATSSLTAGLILKFMYSPGASVLITLGLGLAALVFVPLVFALRWKEQENSAQKGLWAIGSLFATLLTLSVLFKVQHWPGANVMGILAPAVLLVLFLPVYFFSGIGSTDRKVNTVVTSVFIVVGCGLFFTLLMSPHGERMLNERETASYLRNEEILSRELQVAGPQVQSNDVTKELFSKCEQLKASLVKWGANSDALKSDYESKHITLRNASAVDFFNNVPGAEPKLEDLKNVFNRYNQMIQQSGKGAVQVDANVIDFNRKTSQYKVPDALNDIVQLQMLVLQNERLRA
jgi:hypothetical protein